MSSGKTHIQKTYERLEKQLAELAPRNIDRWAAHRETVIQGFTADCLHRIETSLDQVVEMKNSKLRMQIIVRIHKEMEAIRKIMIDEEYKYAITPELHDRLYEAANCLMVDGFGVSKI